MNIEKSKKSDFSELMTGFVRFWASNNPSEAARAGLREFSGYVPNYSKERLWIYRHGLETFKKRLMGISPSSLLSTEPLDYYILQSKIDEELFDLLELKVFERNPFTYASGGNILEYLLKEYAPLDQRIREMALHMSQLPDFYQTAEANLIKSEISPELINVTTFMLKGSVSFLENIISEIKTLENDRNEVDNETYTFLEEQRQKAIAAMKGFANFLDQSVPEAKATFRLGKDHYMKMLAIKEHVSGVSPEELLEICQKDLENNKKEILTSVKAIDQAKSLEEILSLIRAEHPARNDLISETTRVLHIAKKFLKEKDFVTVPNEEMPKVMETPKPLRQLSFAFMNSPGPLETAARNSYYYITPPDDDWSDKEKQQWLETLNIRRLIDITVHEAFPGHFLHSLHNQKSPYLMSKLFGAYHFWEGWAHYVEEATW
ncbi:MAG TPA: DUF885 family protein, partial [Candidatus Hodarchaeales archaeon]|nr:DUF885 family protein [Candidatus Hodarchaeales archaeon]